MRVLMVSSSHLHKIRTNIPNLTFIKNCHDDKSKEEKKIPDAPTTCCMSGCANCVWLEYAEKLSKLYKDGGDKAIKEINENVSDPNMKAFLLHELRMKKDANKGK